MKKTRILTVIGARPQFIKAAPMSKAIAESPLLEEMIIHTGQHFDHNMSDIFFSQMHIPKPAFKLDIHSQHHGAMTGRMMEEIEKIILQTKPDVMLVFGDTNSTLAGALSATKLHVKVAHIEAGLRSFNMKMPEEINRILTDRISDYLFCPTDHAVTNLHNEGFLSFPAHICRTGDIMYDALQFFSPYAAKPIGMPEDVKEGQYVLCTIHRAENTDDHHRLTNIVSALNSVHAHSPVVVPLHPRTAKVISQLNIKPLFHILEPVGYLEMLYLLDHCNMVFTDSGGLQKEAYLKRKNCVTMRDQTEWTELLECGANRLAGARQEVIWDAFEYFSDNAFQAPQNLYGQGNAAQEIARVLETI